jgi:DNA mismatch endonuclease (patch repair protein)
MDVHNPETRSYNMSRIKGKNTKPELLVRKFLFSAGYRYRLHDKKLPGKPDIILPKYKTVIFVHGCFWHGHEDCRFFKIPDTNSEWWREKIHKTRAGDAENIRLLSEAGWKVLVIYECTLKKNIVDQTFNFILSQLSKR